MSSAATALRDDDRTVLDALADGPLSVREISAGTYHAAREAWCDENDLEYDPEKPSSVVKLMGFVTASEHGLVTLNADAVRRVLGRLEKRGAVERIAVEGHRPMLWSRRV